MEAPNFSFNSKAGSGPKSSLDPGSKLCPSAQPSASGPSGSRPTEAGGAFICRSQRMARIAKGPGTGSLACPKSGSLNGHHAKPQADGHFLHRHSPAGEAVMPSFLSETLRPFHLSGISPSFSLIKGSLMD